MKRVFAIFAVMFFSALTTVQAENIVIGERIPDMRIKAWLMDMQPEQADFTCILFYYSESELCKENLKHIKKIIRANNPELNMIILTKEDYSSAGVTLTEHLADNIGVAFDDKGRTFRHFGVNFIPFCVICDSKKRAVWCGNGASLNQAVIDKILTNKKR